jgi:hypothetical protein
MGVATFAARSFTLVPGGAKIGVPIGMLTLDFHPEGGVCGHGFWVTPYSRRGRLSGQVVSYPKKNNPYPEFKREDSVD